ncbi:uncharacterized protein Dwil_GK19049 [Drosophila willistoni]|uniref:Uncharacterized protein n=2 Tax=Drosophila willistoni TaxID=7260 RepID=B4MW77_DROWI|nr:uncharacterized protein Dwil_GK19049 [Drosophila willistoni]
MLIIFVLLVSNLGTIKAQDEITPATDLATPSSDSAGTKNETLETETTLGTESNSTTTESSGIKNETLETGKANVTNSNDSSSTPAMEVSDEVAEPNPREFLVKEESEEVNSTEISTTTDFMDLMTYMQYDNAGDPYARPGKHLPGSRHIRAHDGFHNLKREKYWAHWNDAFTTTKQPN